MNAPKVSHWQAKQMVEIPEPAFPKARQMPKTGAYTQALPTHMPSLKVLTQQLNPGGYVYEIQHNFTIKKSWNI